MLVQPSQRCATRCLLRAFVSGRHRFDSIRLGSGFLLRTHRLVRFDSEHVFSRFDAVRPVFFGRVVARSGSIRFGSVPHPVLAGSICRRFGSVRFDSVRFASVRFGSAGSVRFLIVSCLKFRLSVRYIYIYIFV